MAQKSENASNEIDDAYLAGHTPAMRQFLLIKKEHPSLLLLYRMGDFYETFFEDAEKVHRILGLTLTSRSSGANGDRIPMAGVPFVSLDQYLVRLVNEGISVGICEQIGVPGKGLMERKLVRIITPGTLTDENLLNERKESTLLSLNPSKSGEKIALAWLTISSGDFRAIEIPSENLPDELARITPSEILVPERFRDEAQRSIANASITVLPDWHFDATRSEKTLKRQFGVNTLEPFGLDNEDLMITAAGVIIEYASQTQGTDLMHITGITKEIDNLYLGLDAASRRNLEIAQSLRGDQSNTLISVLDHCKTSMGSRRLLSWLNSPMRSQENALERSQTIEVLIAQPVLMDEIAELLRSIPDFERTATRIALGSVKPRDLSALRDALPQLDIIAQKTAQLNTALAAKIAQNAPLSAELYRLLKSAIAEVPSTFLRDGDVIAFGYNSELDQLREIRDHSGQFLVKLEQHEKERTGIATLRVEYNSVHGYFIEVSKAQAQNVPTEYVRRQTLKNVERFITPELKRFEDQALSAQERSKALEKQLYEELVTLCKAYCNKLLNSSQAVSTLDALYSLALHADSCRWVRPSFTDTAEITIKGGRHPVVEKAIENFVPNNCELNPQRKLLIVTGPNMGGKSTYMRSVALITLLAYCGSFVPAESAVIGNIDKILTRIGAADNLAKGLSTFMVEMTESASILRQATPNSLVLMDEVGRGTSTFDGLSLAGAIAEYLAVNRQSLTLFATHYFELTQLEKTVPSVVNVHVSAAETSKDIVFLHEIQEGPASQSYGIAVAKLAGMPRPVLKGAQKILAKLEEQAAKSEDPQLDLFFENPVTTPSFEEDESAVVASSEDRIIRDELLSLDIDDLSPRQAWDMLLKLQKLAKESAD